MKRHNNDALWAAASTQLQGYAVAPGADGFGVYLVFWFGGDWDQTPARPDGTARPQTAAELERMLVDDLGGDDLRSRTEIIVLDVSRPDAPPKRQRKSNSKAGLTSTGRKSRR